MPCAHANTANSKALCPYQGHTQDGECILLSISIQASGPPVISFCACAARCTIREHAHCGWPEPEPTTAYPSARESKDYFQVKACRLGTGLGTATYGLLAVADWPV